MSYLSCRTHLFLKLQDLADTLIRVRALSSHQLLTLWESGIADTTGTQE